MGIPVNRRRYAAFLSHAHADIDRVMRLRRWLRNAGIDVWFDQEHMTPSAHISSGLADGIGECRSIIILLTKASIASNWVREEFEVGMIQRTDDPAFRIIPIMWEDCEVPLAMRTTSAVDARHTELDSGIAMGIIRGLYGPSFSATTRDDRDVYVAAGWREDEFELTRKILKPITEAGWRPIGDSQDQKGFGAGDRVREIMRSCGALVAILSNRGGGLASPYIIKEMAMAQDLGLPTLIFRDPTVDLNLSIVNARTQLEKSKLTFSGPEDAMSYTLDDAFFGNAIRHVPHDLAERFRPPEHPHYAFLSYKFKRSEAEGAVFQHAKQLITGVSCVPCVDGDNIPEDIISKVIVERISGSFFHVADVTADNINSCIEAGIGLGAGVNVHLVAQGERMGKDRPFMFRDRQVEDYETGGDLIGVLHRLVRPYRRRDLSQEIS